MRTRAPRRTGLRSRGGPPDLPPSRPRQSRADRLRLAPPLALAASLCLGVAEWFAAAPSADVGLVMYGALFVGFLALARSFERISPLAIAFAMVALSRLIGLTASQPSLGPFGNLLLVHVLILVGTVGCLRVMGFSLLGRLRGVSGPYLALPLLVGAATGAMGYLALSPAALAADGTAETLAALASLLVAAASMELLFRNLLLTSAAEVLGPRRGLLVSSAAFALLYLGWTSWAVMLSAFTAGLAYGVLVLRLRAPVTAVVAHAVANVALFSLLPGLLG